MNTCETAQQSQDEIKVSHLLGIVLGKMKTETELNTGSIQMGKMKREGNEERVLYFYI